MNDQELESVAEEYRGAPIFAYQDPTNFEAIRRRIDAVWAITDLEELADHLSFPGNLRETRLIAAARLDAEYQLAIDERRARPEIRIEHDLVQAYRRLLRKKGGMRYDRQYGPDELEAMKKKYPHWWGGV